MSAIAADLGRIVAAVAILSRRRFVVDGMERELPSPGPAAGPGESTGSSALTEELAAEIYHRLYTRRGAATAAGTSRAGRREHLARLSRANHGTGSWDPGWTVRRVEANGDVRAEKYGVVFAVGVDGVRFESGDHSGARCRVRVPSEMHDLVPTFYLALGETDAEPGGETPWQVRLYWHLTPEAAPVWVGELTGRLNRRGAPFALKALADPAHYRRADAGVLYLEPRHFHGLLDEIRAVHRRLRGGLRPGVPLLTARLADGLAVAEGLADVSFGERRCQLIATALVGAFGEGLDSPAERTEAVAAAFRTAGLDPARPHLAAGSTSEYTPLEQTGVSAKRRRRGGRPNPDAGLAETASALGDRLCAEAVRYRDRCNWIGHSTASGELGPAPGEPVMAALGAALWDGTAGIGLFLAQLFARTAAAGHRETAAAAARQALRATRGGNGGYPPLAFYTGGLGVVWAAARVGELTDSEALAAKAGERLTTLLADLRGEHLLDLMSGNAGAILALLDLHRRSGRRGCLEAAVSLGEEIRAAATRANGQATWSNRRVSGLAESAPLLTGLAHGAAGIGLALLELSEATGREDLRADALAAFAYEDALFDSESGNWPDLRGAEDGGSGAPMTAWCHGAPGIALARARAAAIDPARASIYRISGRPALATTLQALAIGLDSIDADTSLCHGQSGLIEAGAMASAPLGAEGTGGLPRRAMRRLVERYGARGWPSGLASRRRNPSLFLGEAGVGYTLLRLLDPLSVPSVLALRGSGEVR